MSTRLNPAERDLEKFIKFLALKATQVVVQSRLGEKMQTQCNPLASGNDWFNIVIQDHPDVYAETKQALSLSPGESILQRLPLCVEISLRTVDGDQMVLEVWSLDLQAVITHQTLHDKEEKGEINGIMILNGGSNIPNSNLSDQHTLKAAHSIYNRMGILLKSLLSLTRATPAYKLSRRQCPESYGIYYRIYVDRPQVQTLGEGLKHVRIGQINTIIGTLNMSVAYRTKMTITPSAQTSNGSANTIMLKSDHFRPSDASQSHPLGVAFKNDAVAVVNRKFIDIEKPLRPGAFTDIGKLRQYTEDDFVLPETPPFDWLLRRTRHESMSSGIDDGSVECINQKCDSPENTVLLLNGLENVQNPAKYAMSNDTKNNNNSEFRSLENDGNTALKLTVAKTFPVDETTFFSQSPIKSMLVPTPPVQRHSFAPTLSPDFSANDKNLLKELNCPFSSPNSHVNDLAKFYRDCYHAPPLHGLSDLQPELVVCGVTETDTSSHISSAAIDDLSRQLEQFETSLEDYDKLVSQLGLTSSSSSGSRSSGGLQMSN